MAPLQHVIISPIFCVPCFCTDVLQLYHFATGGNSGIYVNGELDLRSSYVRNAYNQH